MTEKVGKRVTFGDQQVKTETLSPPSRLFPPEKQDRPSEVLIAENYSLLTSRISQLGDKVERIVAVHERDFMSAFRAHMFQVQKQLVELKKRVDEGEMKLRRDERIVRLEEALGRLQEAALDLEKSEKEARKDRDEWKGKAEEAQGEREFLEKQVVLLMRQVSMQPRAEESCLPPLKPSPPHSFPAPFQPKSDFGRWLDTLSKKHEVTQSDFLASIETHFLAIKSQFDSSLTHLRNTINDYKRSIRSLQTNTSTFATERSELESIFLDCVEEVKREIAIRRNLSDARTVGKFENRDKGKVMELLFSNDKLLGYLYERMFRSTGMSGRESVMEKAEGESRSEQELLKELTVPEESKVSRRSKSSSSGKGKRKDLVVLDGKLMLAR